MDTMTNSRRPAFLCVLVLLVCALATYPVAEIGMNDDWSYVTTTRILVQTGHIVYIGWAAAMLGWQLYLGALFARLFGPSFTAIRASTLLIALITTFLTHRTFVRAGINSRNATIGTFCLVLSPLFLPLALCFMTDMGGLFCIILVLYACLRALQAQSDRGVLAWLIFAALSNVIGGTIRQVAWLGVLVIFPCVVWLLRRRPHVVLVGALLYFISIVFVFASLHWFTQQPFSVSGPPIEGIPDLRQLKDIVFELSTLFLSFGLFLLPVLIAFVPATSFRNRRTTVSLAVVGVLCIAVAVAVALYQPDGLRYILAPFRGNYVTQVGLMESFEIKGKQQNVLPTGLRLFITFAVLFALFCSINSIITGRRSTSLAPAQSPIYPPVFWNILLVLLVPFVLAYLVLLLPLALSGHCFDRYLLPLLPIALILVLRLYQERVQPNLPKISIALVLLFAAYAVAGTHDAFSRYRARQEAVTELRDAGISDASIDAGFEHNAMTQVQSAGHIANPKNPWSATDKLTPPGHFPNNCRPDQGFLTPVLVPGYALSYDPNSCGGLSRFALVTYNEWLIARTVSIYIVNTVKQEPSVASVPATMGDIH